jgi:hypothetical protein
MHEIISSAQSNSVQEVKIMNKKSTNKTNARKTNKTNARKTNKRSASSKSAKASD